MSCTFQIDDRVELPTHVDRWMRGDRYGTVIEISLSRVHVRMDRSRDVLRVRAEQLRADTGDR
ncbi:MAG: hypothetical protein JHD16_00390 [Solirubrobacteraceae bacterium]|nr:hypothetical protein [Solirubrobacteraceae bacterium]